MMDFAHRKGEFAGWSESERQNLLSSLIEAILLSELVPIGPSFPLRTTRA
jgi:hypothetical protein